MIAQGENLLISPCDGKATVCRMGQIPGSILRTHCILLHSSLETKDWQTIIRVDML